MPKMIHEAVRVRLVDETTGQEVDISNIVTNVTMTRYSDPFYGPSTFEVRGYWVGAQFTVAPKEVEP